MAAAANEASNYAPRSVLVTGGAGFIASHVVDLLAARYPAYRLTVLDRLDYCGSAVNLAGALATGRVELVRGDVGCMDLVAHLLAARAIDTVLHFAAQTHVDNSFGNSLAFTRDNTLGTHVLLEACRKAGGVRRFVNVSTDEVYGDTSAHATEGLTEEASVLAPTNPYSAAKAGAEMLCRAYATSYGLPIIITRGNNVYGPRQYPEKLVPKLLVLAARGAPLPVHGDGCGVRSYLYVADVAEAFDRVLHAGRVGETYNIGTDQERSVLDVARDVLRLHPGSASRVVHVRDRAFNDRRYFIGGAKMRDALGWRPAVGWEEGLRRTAAWYAAVDLARHWPTGDLARALAPHPDVGGGGGGVNDHDHNRAPARVGEEENDPEEGGV